MLTLSFQMAKLRNMLGALSQIKQTASDNDTAKPGSLTSAQAPCHRMTAASWA